MTSGADSLTSHLEALRHRLIYSVAVTLILYPVAYYMSPAVINYLVRWCFSTDMSKLHYFSPLEVFWVQLKLALIISLILAYPWNIYQVWKFLLPALYNNERQALRWWILLSSTLFFSGIAFCIGLILPLLMQFAEGFATPELEPLLGLGGFLHLAGWLMFAFGIMFQSPIVVLLAIRFGLTTSRSLKAKRPYIVAVILIIAAILTPPDVISQALLAIPTWLLFELGLILADYFDNQSKTAE